MSKNAYDLSHQIFDPVAKTYDSFV